MQVIETSLPGVLILEPKLWSDARGFFFESYHQQKFRDAGVDATFVQDNHSKSSRGTLRGLHYQLNRPQGKLCRVVAGEVLDVAVDIRHGSPTFGQWVKVLLSADNQRQIWVPRGFAHGFVVLSETAEFLYKCDDFYDPSDEGGIAWNDPQLNIDWEINEIRDQLILSGKDQQNPVLSAVAPEHLPRYSGQ
jgi:dTDP-4-dehydrorhamnose 3,5-epimerase